jgi:hypothetical protein
MELPEYSPTTLAALDPETLVALLASDEDRAPRELIDESARRGDAMLACLEYPRERHRALIVDLAGRQSATDRMFDLSEVEGAFESPGLNRDSDRFRDPWKFYSPGAIAARQLRWAKEDAEADARGEVEGSDGPEWDVEIRPEPVRAMVTPGRNDPCPCGSGKKYKRCCLGR